MRLGSKIIKLPSSNFFGVTAPVCFFPGLWQLNLSQLKRSDGLELNNELSTWLSYSEGSRARVAAARPGKDIPLYGYVSSTLLHASSYTTRNNTNFQQSGTNDYVLFVTSCPDRLCSIQSPMYLYIVQAQNDFQFFNNSETVKLLVMLLPTNSIKTIEGIRLLLLTHVICTEQNKIRVNSFLNGDMIMISANVWQRNVIAVTL